MDWLSPEFIQFLGSLGSTGILAVIVFLFVRGDILSRPVYTKMTEEIVQRVVAEVATRIISGVQAQLKKWESDTARREAAVSLEVAKLKREKAALEQEMEWDNPHMRGVRK
jgi:hypothetical protein